MLRVITGLPFLSMYAPVSFHWFLYACLVVCYIISCSLCFPLRSLNHLVRWSWCSCRLMRLEAVKGLVSFRLGTDFLFFWGGLPNHPKHLCVSPRLEVIRFGHRRELLFQYTVEYFCSHVEHAILECCQCFRSMVISFLALLALDI